MNKILSAAIFGVTGLIGLFAMIYPFIEPFFGDIARGETAVTEPFYSQPLLSGLILGICMIILLIELQGRNSDAKVVASLGVLVAMASVLRFLETAVPGPGGFSPIFVPIILAGYVFGARYGFLMGAITLLTSALITAGIGPWLPYQMLVAGWIGMSAGWLPHPDSSRAQIGMLILFGLIWGLLYGLFLNLFLWPFVTGPALESSGSLNLNEILVRYGAFYLSTSFAWDLVRGFGNAVLILAIGLPAVRIMVRFRDRISFRVAT